MKNEPSISPLPPRPPRRPRRRPTNRHEPLSNGVVFAGLIAILLACIGGYFLVMKLIDISRTEDCLLAGRHNCAPIEVPNR
jgi:hypothetical protein